jgi:site-specific DNA-cytosine methylase
MLARVKASTALSTASATSINMRRYVPVWDVIDAANYGVPQRRERIFIIARRDARPFKSPSPTHGEDDAGRNGSALQAFRTAWDALGDLPQLSDDPAVRRINDGVLAQAVALTL